MKAMSPTDIVLDILKKQGEWMESSLLLRDVMKERNVSDRQAYRDILGACENGEVRKVVLPDETVYGLSNWPFPTVSSSKQQKETLTFKDAFKYRCFKILEEISGLNVKGDSHIAYVHLRHFAKRLPQQQKEKLIPLFNEADAILGKTKGVDFYTTALAKIRRAGPLVEYLIDKVSTVLHES